MKKISNKKDKSDLVMLDENLFSALTHCVKANEAALLIGETGTGKTTIVRELAKENGKNVVRVPLTGSTGIEEILGKWLAKDGSTFWQDGVLVDAMKRGDWIVFDEINAALPEILFALHPLLDDDRHVLLAEKSNERVVPHADFRFFATMNPSEEYSGTKEMNRALVSRFHAVLRVEPLDEQTEMQLFTERFNVEQETAEILATVGSALRKLKTEGKIFYFCSTRDLVQAASLIKAGMKAADALNFAVVNKMNTGDIDSAEGVIKEYISYPRRKVDVEQLQIENKDLKRSVADYKLLCNNQQSQLNEISRQNIEMRNNYGELLTKFNKLSATKISEILSGK